MPCKHCCAFYNVNDSVYKIYRKDYEGNIKSEHNIRHLSHAYGQAYSSDITKIKRLEKGQEENIEANM